MEKILHVKPGDVFGSLTVIGNPYTRHRANRKFCDSMVLCVCKCGKKRDVRESNLRCGYLLACCITCTKQFLREQQITRKEYAVIVRTKSLEHALSENKNGNFSVDEFSEEKNAPGFPHKTESLNRLISAFRKSFIGYSALSGFLASLLDDIAQACPEANAYIEANLIAMVEAEL